MLDIVTQADDFIMLDGVEPAIYDARRLLSVAVLPCMTMELASPVLAATANQMAVIVAAADRVTLPESLRDAVDDADGAIVEAVAAVADANDGGDEDQAREAIAAAKEAVEALIDAATADYEARRRAA